MSYQLLPFGVRRLADGAEIRPNTTDWGDYLRWLVAGGLPEPMAPAPVDLDRLRRERCAAINRVRDRLEQGGFGYAGRVIDSDQRSYNRISAAAQGAALALAAGQPFAVTWTCADNSPMDLDAAGMVGMLQALVVRGAALHAHARDLKGQVMAAADAAAVEAVDINGGWPA